jgi:hypothetical protein
MRNIADVTGGKPIAVLLQSFSGVSAINPLVAFYNIHGGKTEVLFFYFVSETTRDYILIYIYFFVNTYILYIEIPRPNTNRHVHAHKCLQSAGIEPETSCVVGEYSDQY